MTASLLCVYLSTTEAHKMLTMLAQEDREHVLRGMQAIIDSYAVKTVGKASGY